VIAKRKRQFIGFGFDPDESTHHFLVHIPAGKQELVKIEEHFEWNNDEVAGSSKPPIIKVELDKYRWERIAEAAREQFNKRIRASGYRSVSWKIGKENILAPHYGKELTLLAWAVEDIDESLIPNVISNWVGLEPEERWWLYTTVNATFTKANVGGDRGWRKAIKIAFSENPVPEVPPDRFVEEPKAIRLPQRDKTSEKEGVHPSPQKKKRIKKKAYIQSSLFDKFER